MRLLSTSLKERIAVRDSGAVEKAAICKYRPKPTKDVPGRAYPTTRIKQMSLADCCLSSLTASSYKNSRVCSNLSTHFKKFLKFLFFAIDSSTKKHRIHA